MFTPRERNQPTRDELEELLLMLAEANDDGQLVHITFAMQKPGTGEMLVDYRGPHELAEIATRTVRERIAAELEASEPDLANAVRASTGPAPSLIVVTH